MASFALLQTIWLQKTSADEKLNIILGTYVFITGMLLAVIGFAYLHYLMRKKTEERLEGDLFAESNNDIDTSDTTATIKRNILQGIKLYYKTTIICISRFLTRQTMSELIKLYFSFRLGAGLMKQ